jgi:hypothetical protein
VEKTNTVIHMVRNGFMEETYFSLKFIPIFDSEGVTVGHYEPLVETVSVASCILILFSCRFVSYSQTRSYTATESSRDLRDYGNAGL